MSTGGTSTGSTEGTSSVSTGGTSSGSTGGTFTGQSTGGTPTDLSTGGTSSADTTLPTGGSPAAAVSASGDAEGSRSSNKKVYLAYNCIQNVVSVCLSSLVISHMQDNCPFISFFQWSLFYIIFHSFLFRASRLGHFVLSFVDNFIFPYIGK